MVIFGAVTILILVIATVPVMVSSDFAEKDPSDAAITAATAIMSGGLVVVWSALCLGLLVTRGQTGGQYVAGIRLVRDDGAPLTWRNALAWWFSLNPLLFSWPMLVPLTIAAALSVSLVLEGWAFGLALGIGGLCAVMPLVALITGVIDRRNRTLHDRVAGVHAVVVD
jgi:hypothetical protein